METIDKVVRLGKGAYGNVFCRIQFKEGRLSITGVEGPKSNGDAIGSCGQIVMHLKAKDIKMPAPGWDFERTEHFLALWDRWHLNDLTAGSPAQETWVREHAVEFPGYPKSHYEWACEGLAAAGLHPDNGYKYGSARLKEEVPEHVLAFLHALPETDIKPAWV